MSSSLSRCSACLNLPACRAKRYASAVKILLLSFLLLPVTILQSQTVHWSQSSNKNNTQGTVVWIGSIVQSSNSTFYEGQSTLQRLFLVDIPTDPSGHYKLTFKHLATKGSINAYDFVTGWYNTGGSLNGKAITTSNAIDPNCYLIINNCSETGQSNDPVNMICSVLDGAPLNFSNAVPSSSYAGPGGAPAISSGGNVKGRVEDWDANFSPTGSDGRRITIQSDATISNVNLAMIGYDAGNDQYAQYELSWTGPTAPGFFSILVKIGGHIADQQYYGVGNGASNIDGGPYHFKVSNLFLGDAPYDSQHTISLGDRDNQLKGADILIPPPPCDIAPQTQSVCQGGTSQQYCGPAGMAVYAWSISPAGATLSATNTQCVTVTSNTPGTYTLTLVTTNNGVQSTATCNATFIVNPLPTVTANDASVCTGGTVQLTASPAGGTWSGAHVNASGLFNAAGVAAGPYVVTYTYTDANSCTNSDNATVTVNPLPTVTANDASICVGEGTVQLTASPAGGTWSGANVNASGLFSAAGLAAGPYVVTYTYTDANSCTNSDNATVTVNPNPVISCSATPTLIDIASAAHNSQLDVDLSGNADTDPTHYSYAWTEDGVGSFNFSNIKNPVYTASANDAGQAISFAVTVTHIATGCSSESQCSLTVNSAGSCPNVPTSAICNGTTSSYTADRAPAANETWVWSVNNGASINVPNGQQTVSVTAGNQGFTLTLTITYANSELSPAECNFEVTVSACAGSCTYTQGKYGNTSPACDADGTNGTPITYATVLDMIKALLGVNGVANPLYIGGDGISKPRVTIPATETAAALLNASMPGGSTARELFGNCTVDNAGGLPACWTPGTNTSVTYITKQGKINNVLLSQTIALGLNMRVSSGLSDFVLQAGTFATAARDGNCGSTVPKVRNCYYDIELLQWVVTNEYVFKTITQSVIDALNCKTYPLNVAGLYQLANDALANADGTTGTECGASLSDINNAVSAINEGFDNCRIFIGWNETACGTAVSGRIDITASGVIGNSNLIGNNNLTTDAVRISAYPNPFTDHVNFVMVSPVSGRVTLEVYNLFGQKLQTVYDGFITAGRNQMVQFRTGTISSGVLIYKFMINGKQLTGRLMNIKQ
jgi:hypothetical protein